MTEETKGALYHEYRLAYCKALEAVLHGKALSKATVDERHEIVNMVYDEIETKTEFFGDELLEFILDRFLEEEA